jgi:SHS2 domain-containing protein
MAYRFLEHTADVKLEATANSFANALGEAAKGVTAVMTEEQVRPSSKHPVDIKSESKEALLFDFIDRVVYLLDAEGFFVAEANLKVESGAQWRVNGELVGDKAANYERHGDVKAPTYHDLRVEDKGDVWVLRITLDI